MIHLCISWVIDVIRNNQMLTSPRLLNESSLESLWFKHSKLISLEMIFCFKFNALSWLSYFFHPWWRYFIVILFFFSFTLIRLYNPDAYEYMSHKVMFSSIKDQVFTFHSLVGCKEYIERHFRMQTWVLKIIFVSFNTTSAARKDSIDCHFEIKRLNTSLKD